MIKLRYYLFILFCGTIFFQAKATHNRAGEITYKWLYGYTYEIKVTTYTNIGGSNIADRCEDTVYFGDGTKAVVLRNNGPCNGSCSPNGCEGQLLPGNTIKLNEYITTHTYPGPGNYKMSMEDPNRNAGVINIPNSVNQVFYIESFLVIPFFGSGKNSSPILTFPPIDNGCLTQCFYHNPGAYDIDGDSLSYELTTCKGHLGLTCPGYTDPSNGGGVFHIDSLTGTLEWCNPQMLGEYNMAILIKEWRLDNGGNYFLVGYIVRDMQVAIGNCSNVPPQILVSNIDAFPIAGTIVTNTITANDVNGDLLTLSANGGPFTFSSNPSVFNTSPASSVTTATFNWNTNNSHIRRIPYQVTVKVKDNDPAISLVHFKTFNVKVVPNAPMNLSTIPSSNNILLKWNKPTSYAVTGSNPFLRYNIYRKDGLSNWVSASNETTPPAYTGFTYLGSSSGGITDTVFYDYNNGNSFVSGQDYSYLTLAEYTDGAASHVSNISANQIYVGIQGLNLINAAIQTFPNPINESLTILFTQKTQELFTVELMDLFSQKLKTLTSNESVSKQDTIHINLENLSPGIYFLKITGNSHTAITKKIIKH